MAYLFQTFSIGQILTAVQMNQVEANARDHQHGVSGVSSSGMTFVAPVLGAATCTTLNGFTPDEAVALSTKAPKASPVFTTQISTPKITTVSGELNITPAASSVVTLGDGTASATQVLIINGGNAAAKGTGVSLKKGGVQFFAIYDEAAITGAGKSNTPCFLAETGLGIKFMVNGSATAVMTLSSAGIMSAGTVPSSRLFDNAGTTALFDSGTKMTAGIVPLARMMRTEVQGSAVAIEVLLNLGTVVAGDRILVTGTVASGSVGGTYVQVLKSSGTATIDFAGHTTIVTPGNTLTNTASVSGTCRVGGSGTLILIVYSSGYTAPVLYGHAIVLNNG